MWKNNCEKRAREQRKKEKKRIKKENRGKGKNKKEVRKRKEKRESQIQEVIAGSERGIKKESQPAIRTPSLKRNLIEIKVDFTNYSYFKYMTEVFLIFYLMK